MLRGYSACGGAVLVPKSCNEWAECIVPHRTLVHASAGMLCGICVWLCVSDWQCLCGVMYECGCSSGYGCVCGVDCDVYVYMCVVVVVCVGGLAQ